MRQWSSDKGAANSKVQYLLRRTYVDATGKQESVANYPVRAVFMPDYYPTKEGNGRLAVSRRDDVNGTAVSRRRSRRFF